MLTLGTRCRTLFANQNRILNQVVKSVVEKQCGRAPVRLTARNALGLATNDAVRRGFQLDSTVRVTADQTYTFAVRAVSCAENGVATPIPFKVNENRAPVGTDIFVALEKGSVDQQIAAHLFNSQHPSQIILSNPPHSSRMSGFQHRPLAPREVRAQPLPHHASGNPQFAPRFNLNDDPPRFHQHQLQPPGRPPSGSVRPAAAAHSPHTPNQFGRSKSATPQRFASTELGCSQLFPAVGAINEGCPSWPSPGSGGDRDPDSDVFGDDFLGGEFI
jgi:hypothetical protein